MLDDLDAVDWRSLTHAYGEASDVPGQIRSLVSSDEKVRKSAIYELFGSIWHQGTVYPATASAVPFLYELLTAPTTPDKSGVALLLASIADGSGYIEVHAPLFEDEIHSALAEDGKTLEQELAREAAEIGAVRQAASASLPHLNHYLGDNDSEVRAAVAAALGNYPEHSALSLPAIEAAITRESNEEVLRTLRESKVRLTAAAGP